MNKFELANIKIIECPTLPPDTIRILDSVTGEEVAEIINIGPSE